MFFIINKVSGNILRVTDVFKKLKKKKRNKIKPTGMVIDVNKVYLTLDNGRIVVVNINNGTLDSIFKITNSRISQPFINDYYMFIVKDNEIIKLN